ncbi:hypothetical protein An04g01050 [Aspergillus niger]|uniref:Uncharacterized protein n=2 Tax=Aspergillus niger TaxID=5061 RepID=A2QHU2_ASPNC|nr:hypothetical protein An04g01050 [Aspergillus niger]CAK38562.1 hypothetical protein An04g01050 [Aspergillus niger]
MGCRWVKDSRSTPQVADRKSSKYEVLFRRVEHVCLGAPIESLVLIRPVHHTAMSIDDIVCMFVSLKKRCSAISDSSVTPYKRIQDCRCNTYVQERDNLCLCWDEP